MCTIAKVLRFLLPLVLSLAVLFAAAGTIWWTAAWLWIAMQAIVAFSIFIMLFRHDPQLLEERLSPSKQGWRSWDKAIDALTNIGVVVWFVIIGLDAMRFCWSVMPLSLRAVGLVGMLVWIGVIYTVHRQNKFLSPLSKIQREHFVISTGLYAIVRHPLYAANLILFPASALLLGSWLGLGMALVLNAVMVVRTVLEEDMLLRDLPGYQEYTHAVPYRLIPNVW
jgi:protein-S-isoprenylcysteine O-methyltransferase Ste14